MPVTERRRYPRRPFARDVVCYVDGRRLDAFTLDVSLGGSFVATDHSRDFRPGALVGVVMTTSEQSDLRVYLFGSVVRIVTGDEAGLGVQWVRAASIDRLDTLTGVLFELFGLPREVIEQRLTTGTGRQKYVYTFDNQPPPVVEPPPPFVPAQPGDPAVPRAAARGSITGQVQISLLRYPVTLDAVLVAGGERVPAQITMLGARGLDVVSTFVPGGAVDDLGVEFKLPVARLDVPIRCRCRVVGVQPLPDDRSRLQLDVLELDEGRFPSAVVQFVKWLCAREAAKP